MERRSSRRRSKSSACSGVRSSISSLARLARAAFAALGCAGLALGDAHDEGLVPLHEHHAAACQLDGGEVAGRAREVLAKDELVDDGADARHGHLRHDAVGGERIPTALEHLCGARSPEDVDERARALVDLLEVCQAVAAISAVGRCLLAKVAEDEGAQAVRRGGVEDHLTEACLVCLVHRLELLWREVVALDAREEKLRGVDVSRGIEQQAFRARAVAAGTACLLIVVLEGERQIVVDDVAHVALVDAHAKGIRRHHDRLAVEEEILLVALSLLGRKAGVVARRRKACLAEGVAHLLDGAATHAVDDAGAIRAGACELEQRGVLIRAARRALDGEGEVWAVEARHDAKRVAEGKRCLDVITNLPCRRGGERHHGRTRG